MAVSSTLRSVGLLSLFVVQALAAAALSLHEQIPAAPTGWKQTGTPSDSTAIVLQVALAQQNLDQLESKLQSISTPGTASYGQFMDIDAMEALFGASSASKTAVTNWLTGAGVKNYTIQGDSVWFETTVSQANSMLGTIFSHYTDSTGVTKLRTTQYSVPASVQSAIDLISPTTYFGNTKAFAAIPQANRAEAKRQATAVPASCRTTIEYEGESFVGLTPDCLKTEYKINNYQASASSGSKIAFGSFLNQSASFSDLVLFEKYFNIPSRNFTVELVNPQDGATAYPQPPSDADDGEANLDVQYIVGITNGALPVREYITAGSPPFYPDPSEPTVNENEPYLPYYEYLLSRTNAELPQVITNSYGDEEQTVPEKYAIRVCNLIGMLGMRGISVLESSGDEGVGAGCLAQDGKTPQFNPIFPATCPYITAVGGTVEFSPTKAWVGSSGGFSNYFKQPWYQAAAVGTYLNKYISAETKAYYGHFTNFSGRGFPDVAANSVDPDYTVYQGGIQTPSGGTSAASPVTASIVALLNDARLKVGKPALGFLNPLLYGFAYNAFDDVTLGQTDGCNGNDTQTGTYTPGAGVIPGAHWNATVGWDPTTGFGTPDFQKLLALALKF